MAEMTWLYWLTFDGFSAGRAWQTPTMLVHADGCVFPDHVRQVHEQVTGPKRAVLGRRQPDRFLRSACAGRPGDRCGAGWFNRTLGV